MKTRVHIIRRCSQTMTKLRFCEKKFSFVKHDENTVHVIRHRQRFSKILISSTKALKQGKIVF